MAQWWVKHRAASIVPFPPSMLVLLCPSVEEFKWLCMPTRQWWWFWYLHFFRSGQWPWGIIHWCCECYLEQRGIWTSASSNVAPSSGNSDSQLNFPNTFDDAWSKRDINDGLNLSTFSLEEEVQLDLLETLKSLRCPMIAYDEVMKRAVRSCSRGHSFRDIPISSCKTVMGNFRDCVDFEGWPPCWSSFISRNQTATLMLFISEPMLSLIVSFHVLCWIETRIIYFTTLTIRMWTHLRDHLVQV